MQAYRPYAATVAALWRRIERRIAGYPAALRRLGVEALAELDGGARQYFSTRDAPPLIYLPLWAGEALPARRRLDITEATALMYLAIRIQDDVLDEPKTRGRPELLLLGNALLWDALGLMRSAAWSPAVRRACRRAWVDFSDQTEAERRQVRSDRAAPYSWRSFLAHARKHAMAEIPLYVALAEAGRWRRAGKVRALVTELGRAYAVVNDLRGFERDLSAGHRTFLIDEVRARLPRSRRGDPAALRRALLEGGFVTRAVARARRHHLLAGALGEACGLGEPFRQFTAERVARLDELLRMASVWSVVVSGSKATARDRRDQDSSLHRPRLDLE